MATPEAPGEPGTSYLEAHYIFRFVFPEVGHRRSREVFIIYIEGISIMIRGGCTERENW